MLRSILSLFVVLAMVSACGTPATSPREGPGFVNGKPVHPTVKMGDPYTVNGETYVPKYEPNYEETGMASWYGPGFHGKSTANGEDFDQHDFTAAHRTLPLPAMVRVTNLDNGKTAIVRVNDRGPFAHGRIIDLSKAAANKLDMLRTGTAKVKLEYLPRETEAYIAQLGQGKSPQHIKWEQENMEAPTELAASGHKSRWFPSLISSAEASEPTPAQEARVTSTDLPPAKPADPTLPARLPHPASVEYRQGTTSPVASSPPEQKSYVNSTFSVLDADEVKPRAVSGNVPAAAKMAPPATSPPPANAPPVAPKWVIQLGAFNSRANAEKLSERYTSLAPVIINGVPIEAPTIYRVRLGPFTDRYSAETVLSEVREKGVPDAQIISHQ